MEFPIPKKLASGSAAFKDAGSPSAACVKTLDPETYLDQGSGGNTILLLILDEIASVANPDVRDSAMLA